MPVSREMRDFLTFLCKLYSGRVLMNIKIDAEHTKRDIVQFADNGGPISL